MECANQTKVGALPNTKSEIVCAPLRGLMDERERSVQFSVSFLSGETSLFETWATSFELRVKEQAAQMS